MKIQVLHQAAIKLITDKVIYFDPYNITEKYQDADYIFITHDHYDHFDPHSIKNISKENTKIIVPKCLRGNNETLTVETSKEYTIDDIIFKTIPSYNLNKPFHPKEKEYVGYNILLEDEYYYIMGDTDRTPESDNVKADICFVPIGGTYTMNVTEAANYINDLNPKIAIPIHYGEIVGDVSLGKEFKEKINKNIEVRLLLEEEN